MKKIDYLLTNILRWLGTLSWIINFECCLFLVFNLFEPVDIINKYGFALCATTLVSLFVGALSTLFSHYGSWFYTLTHFKLLSYLPINVEEIKNLKLDTVEDYVFKVACILNVRQQSKGSLWGYRGVKGVSLENRYVTHEMEDILSNHYGCYTIATEFWYYLQFVDTKEQSDNLCRACITMCDDSTILWNK